MSPEDMNGSTKETTHKEHAHTRTYTALAHVDYTMDIVLLHSKLYAFSTSTQYTADHNQLSWLFCFFSCLLALSMHFLLNIWDVDCESNSPWSVQYYTATVIPLQDNESMTQRTLMKIES